MPAGSITSPRSGGSTLPRSSRTRSKAPRAEPVNRIPGLVRAGGGRLGRAGTGVRWDRLGSLAMLCVLGALVYLYVSAGLHMLSTWHQARSDSAAVSAMEREHRQLLLQHEALGRRATVEAEARRLGMINKGEQQYIVSGLPNN